jgi:putative transposase
MIRQHFLKTGKLLSEYEVTTKLASEDQPDYRSLPAQTSQQIIRLLFKNWKAFFAALAAFKEDPGKFTGRPRLPRYKKGKKQNIVIFTNQQCFIKNGYITFPKISNLPPLRTKVTEVKQVRIIPQATCFVIEVVYEGVLTLTEVKPDSILSVDLGLNNLATCISNVEKTSSFIVNGRPLKSLNQFFNKKKALFQSFIGDKGTSNRIQALIFKRKCKVEDYLHKTSRFIVDYCLEHEIGTIVIGHNNGWKQKINLGKKTNQNFVSIPFNLMIEKIRYKAEENLIRVIVNEESYTSKVDHLAWEEMKYQESYLGKRVKRGLFKSSTGKLINADCNGSIGIARKVFGNDFVKSLLDRGVALTPVRINLS